MLITTFRQSAGKNQRCGMFVYLGANADGGRGVGEVKNAEECAKWCVDDPHCKSSEFDRESRVCYKHYRKDYTQLNKCCIRFVKVCEPEACQEKFHKFEHRYSLSFKKRYYNTTPDKCKQNCRSASDCQGFSYNPKTRACFMQNDPYFEIRRYRTVSYYMRVKCVKNEKLKNL